MKFVKLTYVQYVAYGLISLLAFGYLLILGKFILAPLIISVFLSFALLPILKFISRFIPSERWSLIVLSLLSVMTIGGLCTIVYRQIQHLSRDLDGLTEKIKDAWVEVRSLAIDNLGLDIGRIEELLKNAAEQLLNSSSETAWYMFDSVAGFLSYIILIPIYTFLLLLYRKPINQRLNLILSGMHVKYRKLVTAFTEMIQGYLKGILIVMLLLGLMNSIGLYFLGVPYSVALGFGVAVFSIIPYIGVISGGILVLLISYATQGSLTILLLIILLFALIQFIEGNFLTPTIVGNELNVNTLLAILALFIGGAIWGIPGMILALPATAAITLFLNQLEEEVFYGTPGTQDISE